MQQAYFRLASIRRRAVAKFIDLATCVFLLWDFQLVTKPWLDPERHGLVLLPSIALWLLGDGFGGRSIGKRMLGLKVVHGRHGSPCGFVESAVRNVNIVFRIFELGAGFVYGVARNLTDGRGMVVIDLRSSHVPPPSSEPEAEEEPGNSAPPPPEENGG